MIIAVPVLIFGYAGRYFKKSNYFKIKDTVSNQDNAIDLAYLKGQNIFSVDLKMQAQYLCGIYPVYKNIRLARILPCRIFIDFIKRKPLAYLKLYKYFLVDQDAVLFDAPQSADMDLPVILGLETKIFGPRAGNKIEAKELAYALNIIKKIQANRALRSWKIEKIDLISPLNASFFIVSTLKNPDPRAGESDSGPLEVKIGQAGLEYKINILSGLLIQLQKDRFNIKYIDLRFKEPVVKFRDKNAKK